MKESYLEYLTAIYKLNSRKIGASNKNISEWLKISAPSVSDMLKKLKNENLIIINKNIVELTELGIEEAEKTLSKHRLWEYFLETILEYEWNELHEDAKLLQYATSDRLMEKINKYLDYPKYCPHGENILINNKKEMKGLRPLIEFKENDTVEIIRVSDIKELLDYLKKKVIKIQDEYKIEQIDIFDDKIVLCKNNLKVSIGFTAASSIYVIKK